MEIIRNKKELFIRVTTKEAMQIIKSMTDQIIKNSPNAGRKEFYSNKGEYFTIAVTPEEPIKNNIPEWDATLYYTHGDLVKIKSIIYTATNKCDVFPNDQNINKHPLFDEGYWDKK